jgi:hypothetical protein
MLNFQFLGYFCANFIDDEIREKSVNRVLKTVIQAVNKADIPGRLAKRISRYHMEVSNITTLFFFFFLKSVALPNDPGRE